MKLDTDTLQCSITEQRSVCYMHKSKRNGNLELEHVNSAVILWNKQGNPEVSITAFMSNPSNLSVCIKPVIPEIARSLHKVSKMVIMSAKHIVMAVKNLPSKLVSVGALHWSALQKVLLLCPTSPTTKHEAKYMRQDSFIHSFVHIREGGGGGGSFFFFFLPPC